MVSVVATVWPNQAGLDSSQPELTLPAKSPFDATVVTLDAGDVLADAILQVASDPLDFPLLKKGRGVAWDLDEAVLVVAA